MTHWHSMYARGHHGDPQPEDAYWEGVYDDFCLRCGRAGAQVGPFRLRSTRAAPHSHFLQVNWVFDSFFVLTDVGAEIIRRGVSGVALGPVLDHSTGTEIVERQQLIIKAVEPCVDTALLPTVTCRPDNEESATEGFRGGEKRYSAETPYCGSVKHHPPHVVAFKSIPLSNADLIHTAERFGSGGVSFRLTLASQRFVDLVREHKWRGLAFEPILTSGHSQRHG